ncbi:MAG TPA: HAD-IIIA family hydrolase [Cytophagaceae bacterium]|jgi:3-deoxy-D-manno-octulosonate 8-phosphate phosphatase (KDO 8-P phosphatase)|nr:HAD-IIIA family hydrolase [Cytophagaceae bacterium]
MNFKIINTFIFDVDGVLTDGGLHAHADGEQTRVFNIKDGFAMEKAVKAGYNMVIISGVDEKGVRLRLERLGVKDIFLGIKDKLALFNDYIKEKNLKPDTILYMGDDIPDYKIMKLVGLPTCPDDAIDDIKEISRYISPFDGGKGAARDVIERVMNAQDKWLKDQW